MAKMKIYFDAVFNSIPFPVSFDTGPISPFISVFLYLFFKLLVVLKTSPYLKTVGNYIIKHSFYLSVEHLKIMNAD